MKFYILVRQKIYLIDLKVTPLILIYRLEKKECPKCGQKGNFRISVRETQPHFGNADTKFNLVIKPKPIFYEVDDIILCDDDRDGRVGGFDLTLRSDELRSGNTTTDPDDEDNQSPNDFTITYHTSLDDLSFISSKY